MSEEPKPTNNYLCRTLAGGNKELENSCNDMMKAFDALPTKTETDFKTTTDSLSKLFNKPSAEIMKLAAEHEAQTPAPSTEQAPVETTA